MGVSNIKWFESYLTGWKQLVDVNGTESNLEDITCGISEESYRFGLTAFSPSAFHDPTISDWSLDSILLQDVSPESWKYSPERQSNETEFLVLEDSGCDRIRNFHDYCAVGNPSTGTSVASSECSDDIYIDLDGDSGIDLFGDLASSVLNILQDIKESDDNIDYHEDILNDNYTKYTSQHNSKSSSIRLSCSNCSTPQHVSDLSCSNCTTSQHVSESYSIDLSCSSCTNYKQNSYSKKTNRKWNELNEEEKVAVVDQISQSISQNLGLREQLEVIRIINPKSNISATERQFFIDITNMTEEKIQKIQDYIKTHSCIDCLSDDSISNSSPRKSKKKLNSQERKNRHRVDKHRQRKEYRQILKEKRSGLFVKEEVFSMSKLSPPPEDEDIDIVG